MTIKPVKFWILVASCITNTLYADNFDCDKHPNLDGWTKGDLIYSETFDNLDSWQAEGNVTISNPNGQLKIQTFGDNKVNKGNVWSRQEFESPFYIEWKFKEIDPASLNLMFWGAHKLDDSDFFEPTPETTTLTG